MPFGAKHQACARHRYPRCNGNRPRSSWIKVLSVHASAASLVSRVGCKVSGCRQSFVEDVSSRAVGGVGVQSVYSGSWTQHVDHHYMVLHLFLDLRQCVRLAPLDYLQALRPSSPPDSPHCNATNWTGQQRACCIFCDRTPTYPSTKYAKKMLSLN